MTWLLAMIGSGETSPTMVTVHRDLVARLGTPRPEAFLLATPYAFQENAAGVSARAQRYFGHSVGLSVSILAGICADADPAMAAPALTGDPHPEREAARIRDADWVFSGPGNPPYALTHWQAGPVAAALRHRVLAGHGVTVLASAAAATAGQFTLPVYEIYKAGGALRWLPGLDLLGPLGLPGAAVIPHYDNTEGRDYDTRYCYLGEHRLRLMQRDLPADGVILGIDEHTAVLIDLSLLTVAVLGRGGLTIRRRGESKVLPAGTVLPLAQLRQLIDGPAATVPGAVGVDPAADTGAGAAASAAAAATTGAGPAEAGPCATAGAAAVPVPLPEVMAAAERRFEQAASTGDTAEMATAILDLESAVADWADDTDEDQGPGQARTLLRTLIARLALGLGRPASAATARGQPVLGAAAPGAAALAAVVEPLLDLRATLRDQRRYAEADVIRNALIAAGLDIRDTPDGTRWQSPGEPCHPLACPVTGTGE